MKKPSAGVRFLLGFLSIVLCICLFFAVIATILILDVRTAAGKDNLQNIVSEILFAPVAARRIPARGMADPGAGSAIRQNHIRLSPVQDAPTAQDPESLISGWVKDVISSGQLGEDSTITYEQVMSFIEESTAKEFLSEKIASAVNDYYTGNSTTTITDEEIRDLIDENKDLIQKHFDVTLTDEHMGQMLEWVETSGVTQYVSAENINVLLGIDPNTPVPEGADSISAVMNGILNGGKGINVASVIAAVRYLTSDTALLIAIGVCLLLMGLLMLTNCTRIHLGLIYSSITILLAGCVMLIPFALSDLISSLIGVKYGPLIQQLLQSTGIVSGIILGIGIALLVTGIVIYCVRKSKIRKAMVSAELNTPTPTAVVPVAAAAVTSAETVADTPIILENSAPESACAEDVVIPKD